MEVKIESNARNKYLGTNNASHEKKKQPNKQSRDNNCEIGAELNLQKKSVWLKWNNSKWNIYKLDFCSAQEKKRLRWSCDEHPMPVRTLNRRIGIEHESISSSFVQFLMIFTSNLNASMAWTISKLGALRHFHILSYWLVLLVSKLLGLSPLLRFDCCFTIALERFLS